MKITHLVLGIIALIILGTLFITLKGSGTDTTNKAEVSDVDLVRHIDDTLGIAFTYNGAATGYTIIESSPGENDADNFLKKLIIIKTGDYELIKNSEGQGGPPTFNITAFRDVEVSLVEWLEENQYFTNYQESAAHPFTISGIQGVRYTWEGMFSGETIAVVKDEKIYLIEGAFHSGTEDTRKADFSTIVDTFSFTQ